MFRIRSIDSPFLKQNPISKPYITFVNKYIRQFSHHKLSNLNMLGEELVLLFLSYNLYLAYCLYAVLRYEINMFKLQEL